VLTAQLPEARSNKCFFHDTTITTSDQAVFTKLQKTPLLK